MHSVLLCHAARLRLLLDQLRVEPQREDNAEEHVDGLARVRFLNIEDPFLEASIWFLIDRESF